jgi:2-aminoadipate transaminase
MNTTQRVQIRKAARSRAFESSPWSEAVDLIRDQPGSIYFGNGAPAIEAQPVERLREAAVRAWADAAGNLEYGELEGYTPLREMIVKRMILRGIECPVDEVMVTHGSQQGIDLVSKLMIDPGDPIIVEGPTYIGAMQTFDAYEAHYVTAPMDSDGINVDALDAMLDETGLEPKLIYTVPTFQNPTGYSLAANRRERLLDLCGRRGILVLEDDPYGEIYFEQQPPPALRATDPAVIYLGTFSKTIAPSLRVGWLTAPPPLMELLKMAREGADINGNRIAMRTVFHAASGFLDGHVEEIRSVYRARRDTMIEGLNEFMPPNVSWCLPGGGFFVWAQLPDRMSANALLRRAVVNGVGFLPGSWFYPAPAARCNEFRLSYSSLPLAEIEVGTRRLGQATHEFIEMQS